MLTAAVLALAVQAVAVGANPNLDVILRSSDETTSFFVRGEFVGKGRTVTLRIDKSESYDVRAEPEGCRSRSDTINPPFRKAQWFSFQFMIADCAPRLSFGEPVEGSRVATETVPVVALLSAKDKLTDVRVLVNGSVLQSATDTLAASLDRARPGRGGAWEWELAFQVALRVGPNTILLEAVDAAGRTGSNTVRVIRSAP